MPFSPTSWPGGGAGVSLANAWYDGAAVSIGNGSSAALTWNGLVDGTELFNRADPSLPAVLAAGHYFVSIEVAPTAALTAGGSWEANLTLDRFGVSVSVNAVTPQVGSIVTAIVLSASYHVPLGGVISATVGNLDGAASRNFKINNATVVLIA